MQVGLPVPGFVATAEVLADKPQLLLLDFPPERSVFPDAGRNKENWVRLVSLSSQHPEPLPFSPFQKEQPQDCSMLLLTSDSTPALCDVQQQLPDNCVHKDRL